MNKSYEIQAQIREVEQRRQAAQDAEAARIAAEQQHQQALAVAEEELVRLQNQQVEAQFAEAIEANPPLVKANQEAVERLYKLLETPQEADWFDACERTLAQVQDTFVRQLNHRGSALAAIDQHVWKDFRDDAFELPQLRTQEEMRLRGRAARYAERLKVEAWPGWAALYHWVSRAPDAKARQRRAGIVFAITGKGQVPMPGPDYDVRADIQQSLQARLF